MPRTLPHPQLHALVASELTREINEWAFQEGDASRRLLDVSASLCIAMQGVRGGYVPSTWHGDAAIMMDRINRRLVATLPADDALHFTLYRELLQKLLAHAMIEAHCGAYV